MRDSELASRLIWSRAGERFERPGAAHRGNPPEPVSSRPDMSTATSGVYDYEAELLDFGACVQGNTTHLAQLALSKEHKPFYQQKVGAGAAGSAETFIPFKLRTGKADKIQVRVHKKKFFRKVLVGRKELDVEPQMRALSTIQQWYEVDITKDLLVKLTIFIHPPKLVQHLFTVPRGSFQDFEVLSVSQALGSQNVVLPLAAAAHPKARCAVSKRTVFDPHGKIPLDTRPEEGGVLDVCVCVWGGGGGGGGAEQPYPTTSFPGPFRVRWERSS